MSRLEKRFAELKAEGRPGLVTFTMACDPDYKSSLALMQSLPEAGADVIELGMPFSDPMADGPAIQAAGLRALDAGASMKKTLEIVGAFRNRNESTPVVLMGYYNPVFIYGGERFAQDAAKAGVDGVILVDLPPEEEAELTPYLERAGVDLVRLIAPTTDEARLPKVLRAASGFIYYVSVAGITGTKSADASQVEQAVARIRKHTELPVAVGFGIKTREQVEAMGRHADAVVVGSAIVQRIAEVHDAGGDVVQEVSAFVRELAGKSL